MTDSDYPLNCIDSLSDGFSGWFAISNPRECNDFCYWHHESTEAAVGTDNDENDENDTGNDDDDDDDGEGDSQYTAWNTANPHQTTVISSSSKSEGTKSKQSTYWVCVYDAADDSVLTSQAQGQRWMDTWKKYVQMDESLISDDGVPFPFLRCQKGAGEKLKTTAGELVKSATFWESWIVLATILFLGEMGTIILYCKRRQSTKNSRYERVGRSSIVNNEEEDSQSEQANLDAILNEPPENTVSGPPTHRNSMQQPDDDVNDGEYSNKDSSEMRVSSLGIASSNIELKSTQQHVTPRCKYCAPIITVLCKEERSMKWWIIVILKVAIFIALNVLLAFTITFSEISLMEIHSSPSFKESMEDLTPQCLDPNRVCPAGNKDIMKDSTPWTSVAGRSKTGDAGMQRNFAAKETTTNPESVSKSETKSVMDMPPFSYLIASDAQLYWFNGEFADMGVKNIPPACSPHDSCGRCTGKHGYDVNLRLKKAWESMMTGEVDGMEARKLVSVSEEEQEDDADLPVPNTLIMNGDLTAYFHPHEKYAYESIYKDVGGLKYYFPSLGNHDIEHMSGAKYGGDQWTGPPNCNIEHAIGYFKSGFCGEIPNFHTDRIVRYDSSSLAYSWEEGGYHFVHTHYYPAYEMASMKFRSSLEWLENDLKMAYEQGFTTILFIHAVQYLNPAMERIILGKNVVAIFAGHTHRCLHRKCEGIYPVHEDQAANLNSLSIPVQKCIPAAYDVCEVLNGENLIYTTDLSENVTFPKKKLHNTPRTDQPLCPKPAPFYINETDNSLLCRRVFYSEPNFPFEHDSSESIPIFWSGASSFETFLRADYYSDRIVINAMTVLEDGSVARYLDVHDVPNARYPYHDASDLDEVVIHL